MYINKSVSGIVECCWLVVCDVCPTGVSEFGSVSSCKLTSEVDG